MALDLGYAPVGCGAVHCLCWLHGGAQTEHHSQPLIDHCIILWTIIHISFSAACQRALPSQTQRLGFVCYVLVGHALHQGRPWPRYRI